MPRGRTEDRPVEGEQRRALHRHRQISLSKTLRSFSRKRDLPPPPSTFLFQPNCKERLHRSSSTLHLSRILSLSLSHALRRLCLSASREQARIPPTHTLSRLRPASASASSSSQGPPPGEAEARAPHAFSRARRLARPLKRKEENHSHCSARHSGAPPICVLALSPTLPFSLLSSPFLSLLQPVRPRPRPLPFLPALQFFGWCARTLSPPAPAQKLAHTAHAVYSPSNGGALLPPD